MKEALVFLCVGAFWVGCFLLALWLPYLALGVVLTALGVAKPAFWVFFCGWFCLVFVATILRGGAKS